MLHCSYNVHMHTMCAPLAGHCIVFSPTNTIQCPGVHTNDDKLELAARPWIVAVNTTLHITMQST